MLCEVLVADVCERLAAPETERLTETGGRALGIAPRERIRSLLGERFVRVQVETARRDPEDIPRRARLDCRGISDCFPKLRDLPLNLRDRGGRRRARIQVVGKPVHGDDRVRLEEQDGERLPLLGASEPHRSTVLDDLERPEDLELEHSAWDRSRSIALR